MESKNIVIGPDKRQDYIVMQIQEELMNDLNPLLQKHSLTFSQYLLLNKLVDEKKPLSMTEIASCMQHTTAAATGLIDRSEQKCIVVRCPSKEDRRQVMVVISKKGLSILEHIKAEMRKETLLECLTIKERSMWMALHEKVFGLNTSEDNKVQSKELVAV